MYRWRDLEIPRFYGVDLKTNVIDVKDGFSLGAKNVFQDKSGVVSKRAGNGQLFAADAAAEVTTDEIGQCTLSGQKYYFKFEGGDFFYATTANGALTAISPSPEIEAPVWYAVLDDKLFFVDGVNALRYFTGSAILTSSIYLRPTVALSTAGAGTGFDYTYTVDNGLGESPASSALLLNEGSAETVTVQGNTGPQTLVAGDTVRIYSKATSVAAANKLVATYVWTPTDVTNGSKAIATVAISDTQAQLYTELGLAVNKSAPTGLVGIIEHYGRLVGWMGDYVHNSKSSNPHSWPDNAAVGEAFVYGFGVGDGEDIQAVVSFRESAFVMKKTKIAVFAGVGPDDSGGNAYSFRRLETNGIGLVAPKSAVVVGEETGFIVFLSRVGFYATNGDAPIRIGEKIETDLLELSESNMLLACAVAHKRLGLYVCWVGGPTARKTWVLDTRKDNDELVGWFPWEDLAISCVAWDESEARYIFGTYNGWCGFERAAGNRLDFSDVRLEWVAAASFNATTDRITVANQYALADEVVIRSAGTMPSGITANTVYYAIPISATLIQIATSAANAAAGTFVNFTTSGSGTHTISAKAAIDAFYTTNWLRFKSSSVVKKLGKPSITLNALASSASITMRVAYDWKPNFGDPNTISFGSSHLWGDANFPWGSFVWGDGAVATPKNVAIKRRKCRSIRYRFENSALNQDFDLQALVQTYDYIRNRGNYSGET